MIQTTYCPDKFGTYLSHPAISSKRKEGEIVEMGICTQPTQAAAAIYDKLGFRHYPFRKMKICSAQT